jgi:hypothetical protein
MMKYSVELEICEVMKTCFVIWNVEVLRRKVRFKTRGGSLSSRAKDFISTSTPRRLSLLTLIFSCLDLCKNHSIESEV